MDRTRRSFANSLVVAVVICLTVAACSRGAEQSPAPRGADQAPAQLDRGPVLQVEGAEFSNADLRSYLRSSGAEDIENLPDESLSRLFDRFVDERILLEAARRRNITLDEDEKRAHLARMAADAVPGEGEGAARTVAPPEGLEERLLVEKYTYLVIRDVQVEPAEIEEYYEAHKKDFLLPERIRVSQILVDTEDKAVSVLRRLERTGEREFRKIAREESAGPEAARDGVMGVFKPGDLPADMERVIFSLSEGRTSQIVESAYGYHIFRLDKKFPPALRSLEEAVPAIRSRLLSQKIMAAVAAHLEGLKDTLSWQTFPENLFFRYQRTNG
jgi:peptidyl-prolyl cis-trans isomerase C